MKPIVRPPFLHLAWWSNNSTDLIPTILSLSTVYLTLPTLLLSFQQVCSYVSHFKTRLSPTNLLHLKRLVIFLDSLKAYAAKWKDGGKNTKDAQSEVMTVGELISRLGKKVAGINLMEVEAYLKKSKVSVYEFYIDPSTWLDAHRLQGK